MKLRPMRASAPHLIAAVLFFVTLLAGRYSTDPLRGERGELPFFLDSLTTEVRYPCFALLLMALVIAARQSRPSEFARPNTGAGIASVIALHLYIAFSALWSDALDGQVLYRAFEAIQLIALILIAYWLFGVAPGLTGTIFFTLCFGAGLLYAFGSATGEWNMEERAAAFGGGPNIFVRVVGTGLLASLYLWAKSGSWWWIAASPVLLISAVLSGSRGGMLGLLAAVPLLTAFVLRDYSRRVWSGLAVIAAAFVVLNVAPSLGGRVGTFWTERYVDLTFEKRYLSSRDSLFTSAWDLFCRHPVVGAGLNGFQQATGLSYPHNLILNVASEGGVIGLMFLTLTFLFVIARCFRPMTLEQKAALSAGLFYFIASMFSGTYYDARFMWVFVVMFHAAGRRQRSVPSRTAPTTTDRGGIGRC